MAEQRRIRVLDPKTIAQIAAGEVIERPASVVKELVENALDAGASRVTVEVKGGGTEVIRVTDDGAGIPAAELATAFERHATSKITGAADLFNIASLGFRGEALPSIAAVADVEVLTQAEGETGGSYLRLENGAVTRQEARARPRGTTVTVRDLFRRVPARRKFLKSPATENGRLAAVVSEYALARPGVSFSLLIEGKPNLRTAGRGALIDGITDVYGAKVAARMLPVAGGEQVWTAEEGDRSVTVTGMVGMPDVARKSRSDISFFVNGRWVMSRTLSYAVEEAYHGLLMTGRHPVAVLTIDVPPAEVDVNIHPAKSEVKFRHESDVFRAVQRAVRGALTAELPVTSVAEPPAPFAVPAAGETRRPAPPAREAPATPSAQPVGPSFLAALPALRVIGQVMQAYIVAEGPDGLYVIDQHAAHERVRFDALAAQRAAKKPEVQGLLEPGTLEFTPRQAAVLDGVLPVLAELGFAIEPFGERSYLVRAVPVHLAKGWDAALKDLLEELSGEEKSRWEEKTVASIACHHAIRSGQSLSMEEMVALVRQLERTASPHTCPHGRPTIVKMGRDYLERHFGR
jgi:DNA mismatch repair protein MutL